MGKNKTIILCDTGKTQAILYRVDKWNLMEHSHANHCKLQWQRAVVATDTLLVCPMYLTIFTISSFRENLCQPLL